MKILFLTNNIISEPLYNWLIQFEDVIKYEDRITIELIEKIKPDWIISYNYRHLVKEEIIKFMPNKIINLHISYLPYNKGAHPNIWSVLEDTPKGVTIHLINKDIDGGDILVQKKINFDLQKETLKTSYYLLHKEIVYLFEKNWGKIKNQKILPIKQKNVGTIHYVKNFERLIFMMKDFNWDLKFDVFKEEYEKLKIKNGN
jgi:methionyl-tRNA formyltransferase